jgi:hypothetical protein
LPSVWKFAECILSGTQQKAILPSAEHKTLSERQALGKVVVCRVPDTKHSANKKHPIFSLFATPISLLIFG